ncbi:tRNA(Ile)-lysidine synthetase [Arcobacter nitrofigilis DSM 7299]|uniref:tRNA(Ile)-lysidine synthase n=1 Tax=Arcobacter nitrofigilis (strain ATCC 33309 / DSM 7299 / CCUG 15893 / LMG 7604 / NCTC 12251 / CI) TaxID=572480 RepID=D5V797_ARCNC|nr:tRNA lysidine(34) synthetase TilS [Arcobacter nitrofigilis]ADG94517.1 tRNA(Ile)-lysidine synthetase [Arcobacter nitrofigilis DSM 7299]
MIKFNINTTKNLLAFSGGIDSSALFFLLLNENIPFDIAIVNYNQREQSKDEVAYAKELANKYNKKCFLKEAVLTNNSNFEKEARDIRYDFFDKIIKEYDYDTLITAHQLNDKLEWFMMQLSKGAGLVELIGLEEKTQKDNYVIYRPLLELSKEELQIFLQKNNHKYFIDESNYDEKYKRNYFRKNFVNELIKEYKDGIKNSFKYLKNDIESLNLNHEAIYKHEDLEIFTNHQDENLNIKIIDKSLKRRGILLSNAQRNEIIRQREITISDKINISISNEYIYICPKVINTMDKKFKEICRVLKIPKNIRAYLFEKDIEVKELFI